MAWFERIEAALQAHGHRPHLWDAGDGQLMLLPHGARVLACRLPGVADNLFWHHPDLERPQTIAPRLTEAAGVLGGDRLWIAPEVGLMWPDLQQARRDPFGTYRLLPDMDPGQWSVIEEEPGLLRLGARMALRDGRTGKSFALRVSRRVTLSGPPAGLPPAIRSLSFAITNEITLLEGDDGAVAGTWDILQLPAGGSIVCPVADAAPAFRTYFGDARDPRVRTEPGRVSIRLDARQVLKVGLRPESVLGRAGYYRPLGDLASLVVRCFNVLPGEPYVDLPLSEAQALGGGDAFQCYNDGGKLGQFGELEYHDAALVAGTPPHTRTATSVTHVLVGPPAAIQDAARRLLGVSVPT